MYLVENNVGFPDPIVYVNSMNNELILSLIDRLVSKIKTFLTHYESPIVMARNLMHNYTAASNLTTVFRPMLIEKHHLTVNLSLVSMIFWPIENKR